NDQSGTPTYAADLAEAIIKIISTLENPTHGHPGRREGVPLNTYAGIYHYSNEGHITWYDFAVAIKELSGSACKVNPISTAQYPTAAKRPFYSVLDKTKIQQTFGVRIKDWKTSLAVCSMRISK
ncbi:MAG: SDR family oxidoreductase, partial [Chitinophagales bacterium]